MQTLAIRMANELNLLLLHPVSAIEQTHDAVTVHTAKFQFRAKKAIVAIPPTLALQIKFAPEISAQKTNLWSNMNTGRAIKCCAIYQRPFWRDSGWSGQVVAGQRYPLQTIFDNSPPDSSKGILMGIAIANRAIKLKSLSKAGRRKRIIDTFVHFFGTEARHPLAFLDKIWTDDPNSLGSYTCYRMPGAWTTYRDALSTPTGNIHWAGTETSPEWNGYMEGAVLSGIRAANEILSSSLS